jgi:hypothetical protein
MLRLERLVVTAVLAMTLTACAAETADVVEPIDLAVPQGEVVLEVRGNLARINGAAAARFDMDMLTALPAVQLKTSTSVTDGVRRFEGILVRDFLKSLGAKGSVVTAIARNEYVIDIPFSDFERFDAIIAYRMDGEPLALRDKGPLWIVYPRDARPELQDIRYDYRWVWQLEALEIR